MYAGLGLQHADHAQQIFRRGIAARPEHPHQALLRPTERRAESLKSDRRIDIGTQSRAAVIDGRLATEPASPPETSLPGKPGRARRALAQCRENPWSRAWHHVLLPDLRAL